MQSNKRTNQIITPDRINSVQTGPGQQPALAILNTNIHHEPVPVHMWHYIQLLPAMGAPLD